nr:CHAT domain-containing protein [Salsipaludibacter albus]
MRGVVGDSLRDGLARLDALLATPLDAPGRDLVVVPHADLALVPWSLLPSRAGAGTVTSPSATRWVRRRGRPPTSAPVVRALAGPDLDRAHDEVADVAATWGTTGRATAARGDHLRAALAEAEVVHLAAHGVHHAAAPLFSSVRLEDGPFYAHDLSRATATRLVVLSACDVAEHAMRPGDEPLGFAAALLDTGVDVVVGAVAPIRDDVAARVGSELHRYLAGGSSPARAVSRVVADAGDDGGVAPMVVLGNGLGPVADVTTRRRSA